MGVATARGFRSRESIRPRLSMMGRSTWR